MKPREFILARFFASRICLREFFSCHTVAALLAVTDVLLLWKRMTFDFKEWCNLALRWAHVFAGILWVGTTYYFTWLDGRFSELEKGDSNREKRGEGKEIWMVHSGGFYRVEKLSGLVRLRRNYTGFVGRRPSPG